MSVDRNTIEYHRELERVAQSRMPEVIEAMQAVADSAPPGSEAAILAGTEVMRIWQRSVEAEVDAHFLAQEKMLEEVDAELEELFEESTDVPTE